MSILVITQTRPICQSFTGSQGTFRPKLAIASCPDTPKIVKG